MVSLRNIFADREVESFGKKITVKWYQDNDGDMAAWVIAQIAVILVLGLFVGIVFFISTMSRLSCDSYGRETGRSTEYGPSGCLVQTDNGIYRLDQIIYNEGE